MIEPAKITKQIEKSEKIGASIFDAYSDGPPQGVTSTENKNDLYRGFYFDHQLCGNSQYFRKPKNVLEDKSINNSKLSAFRVGEDDPLGLPEGNPFGTSNQEFIKSS